MDNKKCQVISVINFKGGVGKSTVTLNLGSELANRGYRVLLIDFDAQGNLTKYSGVTGVKSTIADVLYAMLEKREIRHPVYRIKEDLDIVCCNPLLARWIIDLHNEMFKELKLRKYIDLIKKDCDYDIMLIDNARDIGVDLQNTIFASDKYIIVSDAEQGGLDGVEFILDVIKQIKEGGDYDIASAGIVLNRCKERSNLHSGVLSVFEEEFGNDHHIYSVVIPDTVDIGTSNAIGVPVSEYKKSSKAAEAYRRFTDEFIAVTGLQDSVPVRPVNEEGEGEE